MSNDNRQLVKRGAFATITSQTRVGSAPFDIGFHCMAVDGGDTEYMITLTDPNNIGLTGLQVYTPLKR